MGQTEFVQTSFLGGEWSQSMQGRIDRPDYRTAMNVCLNTIPVPTGAAQRRPGTRLIAPTRGGLAGRVIPFSFVRRFPYNMEFTDGWLRFNDGAQLIPTNDQQVIVSISTASPAAVKTVSAHGWSTGNSVLCNTMVGAERIQNRALLITVLSATTFSIADAITGAAIDGSTIGAFTSGNVARILEIATPYAAGSWQSLRSVQAERRSVLLNGSAPQVLAVNLDPTDDQHATFALSAANFLDGPYLDPIPGSYITSSALNGVVTLTLSFQPYSASVAYNIGDYVTSGGQGYKSIAANNQNNAPPNATYWRAVNAGDPINGGAGLSTGDIGRLIRLFSEPQLWNATDTFASNAVVAYDPGSGIPQYWKNITAGNIAANTPPGTSTSWSILLPGALWTWGRILTISGAGIVAPDGPIGSMTGGGGIASAFDGNTSKSVGSSANASSTTTTFPAWATFTVYAINDVVQHEGIIYRKTATAEAAYGNPALELVPPPATPLMWAASGTVADLTVTGFVGAHYAAGTAIDSVTVYPTADIGFTNGAAVTVNLRASVAAPASPSDGTLIASVGNIANRLTSVVFSSSDKTTAFNYIWVELTSTYTQPLPDNGTHVFTGYIGVAQMVLYTPNVNNGSVFTAQIAGPAMLYANTMRKWRLGLYGGANGWPKNGTYHEGRLWLSGVLGNRVDGSKTLDNALPAAVFDFAPTAPNGVVADDNAIAATFDGPDINAILWMVPDQQGILCGTDAGEWLVSPPAPGALTPTNTAARRVTRIGCADIEPRRTDHTLVFVQGFRRKVMEYFADVYSGKFSAPNLSEKSEHLTIAGIAEIAYQKERAPIIWQRLDSGGLIGATYQRNSLTTSQGPNFAAGHRHQLGSGYLLESICVGPSAGSGLDGLAMVTRDPATNIHYNEVMTDILDEQFLLSSIWYVDCGIKPTSIALAGPTTDMPYGGLTINGLWPHNGKEITAVVGGLDCGEYTVANGSITVPFGDGISPGGSGTADGLFTQDFVVSFAGTSIDVRWLPMAIGFTYTSDGQIVRVVPPLESGSRAGPAFQQLRRIHRYGVLLYGALDGKISFGVEFSKLRAARLTSRGGIPHTHLDPWSGVYRSEPDSDYDFENLLCWRMDRPVPGWVVAFGGVVQTQEG